MSNNGPISVSAPNKNLLGAVGKDITFNTSYPFAKIDSTNNVSFQIINILFLTEPPNPDGSVSTYQRNLIYQFAHGYTYVPSTWFMVSNDNFTTALGTEGVVLTGNSTVLGAAILIVTVDSTNVNFYVDKYWGGIGVYKPVILGTSIEIRSYVFVNDLTGTDVPTSA